MMKGSVLEVVEGSQTGGELVVFSQLAGILAEREHLKRTGQLYHSLKQYRSHLKDQSVFKPSLPHSLMAVMVTGKNSVCCKVTHSVTGCSDVLLVQTFLTSLNPLFNAGSFPEHLRVFTQCLKLKNHCYELLERVLTGMGYNPWVMLWHSSVSLHQESRCFPFTFKNSISLNNHFPACSYCSAFAF